MCVMTASGARGSRSVTRARSHLLSLSHTEERRTVEGEEDKGAAEKEEKEEEECAALREPGGRQGSRDRQRARRRRAREMSAGRMDIISPALRQPL